MRSILVETNRISNWSVRLEELERELDWLEVPRLRIEGVQSSRKSCQKVGRDAAFGREGSWDRRGLEGSRGSWTAIYRQW